MKVLELAGTKRVDTGKKSTKKLRVDGLVPCVIYGKGENLHFSIVEKELRPLIYTPHVYLLAISIDGKVYDAVLKDIQFHAVEDNILHVDFYQIANDEKITIDIPVILEGFPVGVKAGGKLNSALRKLTIKAFKGDLPDTLKVNVEELTLGSSLKVRDLTFENLEILNSGNSVIASVKLTRAAKGELGDDEEGAEEGAEASEAEAPAAE